MALHDHTHLGWVSKRKMDSWGKMKLLFFTFFSLGSRYLSLFTSFSTFWKNFFCYLVTYVRSAQKVIQHSTPVNWFTATYTSKIEHVSVAISNTLFLRNFTSREIIIKIAKCIGYALSKKKFVLLYSQDWENATFFKLQQQKSDARNYRNIYIFFLVQILQNFCVITFRFVSTDPE